MLMQEMNMTKLSKVLGAAAVAAVLGLASAPASSWWGTGYGGPWGGGPWYGPGYWGGPYGGYPYYGGYRPYYGGHPYWGGHRGWGHPGWSGPWQAPGTAERPAESADY